MIVLDASVVVELLPLAELGARVGLRLRGEVLNAPAHVDAEIVGALRCAEAGVSGSPPSPDRARGLLSGATPRTEEGVVARRHSEPVWHGSTAVIG